MSPRHHGSRILVAIACVLHAATVVVVAEGASGPAPRPGDPPAAPSAPAAPSGAEPGVASTGDTERPDAYARALSLYRERRWAEAASILDGAIRTGAGGRGYASLLGWCRVQMKRFEEAEAAFRAELKGEPGNREARQGLAAALAGRGRAAEALGIALALLAENPGDDEVVALARRVLDASRGIGDRRLREEKAAAGAPAPLARAGRQYLEARWGGRFHPIFVKGVNLGVALPGRFPAEFPEEIGIYREWLDRIATMGANAVRLYTLLPPVFYEALHDHNAAVLARSGAAAGAPSGTPSPGEAGGAAARGAEVGVPPRGFIWLIQGVWTELPEADRYDDPAFEGAFTAEMERILDVLHGNRAVPRRPGHAFGLYRRDVASMTLALILGREWEPYSVEAFDRLHPHAVFEGRYFRLEGGTAMEAWIAKMMDHAVGYETERYATARPVAFTNWPTLDPLRHPTEATKEEENAIAERLGLPWEGKAIFEYDNDGVSIDANRIRPTGRAPAGQFASYHAYPYYPDFMNVDPGYLEASDAHGPNNYVGYLAELRRHHDGLPVLISEVGVPTSRGVAHVQPQGFHHGGHSEREQGEIDARLVENIHETGCAGAVLFAWIDEWFKRNWLVMDFEVPAERNPKWLNVLDPEQNYGLIAARPGIGRSRFVLDGAVDDWTTGRALVAPAPDALATEGPSLRALWAGHDAAYLQVRLDTTGLDAAQDGRLDWDRLNILVGLDTYGAEEGDHLFPLGSNLRAPSGMEFMVHLAGPGKSRLLVDPPYDLYAHRRDRPYRSIPNEDGVYTEILVETNRRRIGRDGTVFREIVHDRSPLRFGTTDPESPQYDDLADWFADPRSGTIELRLAWGLLNVTDPSSRRVVADTVPPGDAVGTKVTGGIRLYAALVGAHDGSVVSTLPPRDAQGKVAGAPSTLYAWDGWEEPVWHTRPKKSYDILRERLAAIPDLVTR